MWSVIASEVCVCVRTTAKMNKIKVESLIVCMRCLWCNLTWQSTKQCLTQMKHSVWVSVLLIQFSQISFEIASSCDCLVAFNLKYNGKIGWFNSILIFSIVFDIIYAIHIYGLFARRWIICCFNCSRLLIKMSLKIKTKCDPFECRFEYEKDGKLCYFTVNQSFEIR